MPCISGITSKVSQWIWLSISKCTCWLKMKKNLEKAVPQDRCLKLLKWKLVLSFWLDYIMSLWKWHIEQYTWIYTESAHGLAILPKPLSQAAHVLTEYVQGKAMITKESLPSENILSVEVLIPHAAGGWDFLYPPFSPCTWCMTSTPVLQKYCWIPRYV